MDDLTRVLATSGTGYLEDIYSHDELQSINTAIDPLLAGRSNQARSYVHIDEMQELGLLDTVLSPRMRSVLFTPLCDPVLYHCHIYEIAGNSTRSHVFGETLSGWHRDPDCEYHKNYATHISVFVYLTDVGDDDGTFQFLPQGPDKWLWKGTPRIAVTGKAGFSFAWNRAYFHRAAPNRGPRRRRLLKISVQPNRCLSIHLANKHFQRVNSAVPPGDPQWDTLLGRYQGAVAPKTTGPDQGPKISRFATNGELGVANADLLKFQVRTQARTVKSWLSRSRTESVSYD
jgi:hypothetical protein